jgi:hypothetical protein
LVADPETLHPFADAINIILGEQSQRMLYEQGGSSASAEVYLHTFGVNPDQLLITPTEILRRVDWAAGDQSVWHEERVSGSTDMVAYWTDLDGNQQFDVPVNADINPFPVYSVLADKMAIPVRDGSTNQLMVFDFDGVPSGAGHPASPLESQQEVGIRTFAPDSTSIVATINTPGTDNRVYFTDLRGDGSAFVELDTLGLVEWSIGFTSDSQMLWFVSTGDDARERLYMMDVSSGAPAAAFPINETGNVVQHDIRLAN